MKSHSDLNTVKARYQLAENDYVMVEEKKDSILKILFVGNSITFHAQKESIGWCANWGMAASKEENDYVHKTVSMLEKEYGNISFCIAQVAAWESEYDTFTDYMIEKFYSAARNFHADIIVMRLGENINLERNKINNSKPYYDKLVNFFVSNNTKQIIITDTFWRDFDAINTMLKNYALENDYLFCELSDLPYDEKTMALGLYEHQGICVHPSDYGMKKIAERIVGKISTIVLEGG